MAGGENGDGRGRPSSHDTGRVGGDDLAVKLSDLARTLQDENDVEQTLDAIAAAAVDTVPGAEYAALSVVERRHAVYTRAGTAQLAYDVDKVQYETHQGPCLDAAYEQRTVRVPDMSSDERWPEFARRAAALGVGSMLSFQLFVQQDNLGALNLYSSRSNAFDDESEHVGLLFASHAAVAMSGAQHQEQMERAISARDVIGQAKGILMERHKITADQAFTLLARASQENNIKLLEVARALTDTGELSRGPHR
jgi:GAF domain-containing protein